MVHATWDCEAPYKVARFASDLGLPWLLVWEVLRNHICSTAKQSTADTCRTAYRPEREKERELVCVFAPSAPSLPSLCVCSSPAAFLLISLKSTIFPHANNTTQGTPHSRGRVTQGSCQPSDEKRQSICRDKQRQAHITRISANTVSACQCSGPPSSALRSHLRRRRLPACLLSAFCLLSACWSSLSRRGPLTFCFVRPSSHSGRVQGVGFAIGARPSLPTFFQVIPGLSAISANKPGEIAAMR